MLGVAGPLMNRSPRTDLKKFLLGYWIGTGVGSTIVLGVIIVVAEFGKLFDEGFRRLLTAGLLAFFGFIDLSDRTIYLRRQTPARLAGRIDYGVTGAIYGFDIGLLFSTQKSTSLIWVGLTTAALISNSVEHQIALLVLVVFPPVLLSLLVARRTYPPDLGSQLRLSKVRLGTGLTLVVLGLSMVPK